MRKTITAHIRPCGHFFEGSVGLAKSLHNAFSDDDNNDVHNYPDDYDHHVILMMFMLVPVFVGLLNGTLAVGLVPGKYIKRHLVKIYKTI